MCTFRTKESVRIRILPPPSSHSCCLSGAPVAFAELLSFDIFCFSPEKSQKNIGYWYLRVGTVCSFMWVAHMAYVHVVIALFADMLLLLTLSILHYRQVRAGEYVSYSFSHVRLTSPFLFTLSVAENTRNRRITFPCTRTRAVPPTTFPYHVFHFTVVVVVFENVKSCVLVPEMSLVRPFLFIPYVPVTWCDFRLFRALIFALMTSTFHRSPLMVTPYVAFEK